MKEMNVKSWKVKLVVLKERKEKVKKEDKNGNNFVDII